MACLSSQCVHFIRISIWTHIWCMLANCTAFFVLKKKLQSVVIFCSLFWHLGVLWLSESSGNLDRLIRLVIVDEFVYMVNLCFFFSVCLCVACVCLLWCFFCSLHALSMCALLCCFVFCVCVGPTPAYSCKKQNSWRESGTGSTPQSLSTPSQTPPSTRPTFTHRRRVRHGRPTGPSPLRLPASPPRPPHRRPRHRPRRAAAGLPPKSRGSRRRRERTQTQKTVQSSAWLKVNKPRQTKPLQRQKVRLHRVCLVFFPFSVSRHGQSQNISSLIMNPLSCFLFFVFLSLISPCATKYHVWPLKRSTLSQLSAV